jgi:hypothetical protein
VSFDEAFGASAKRFVEGVVGRECGRECGKAYHGSVADFVQ